MDYKQRATELPNGLTVVTVSMPHLHSANLSVFVRVGSRHEDQQNNGLSHFLEHMFFRGCDGFPDSAALNAAMEDLGGFLDGYTTRDYSAYQSTVHPDFITEAAEIVGQMFTTPHFQDIAIERDIILEEILDVLDDRGREVDLDTIAHRHAFNGHPIGFAIDGTRSNVRRFAIEDLKAHRKRFYGARNMVLCFSGNIDPAACRRAARRSFGKLFSGKRAKEGRPPKLPARAALSKFVHADDAQTRARLSFRTIPEIHKDYPAMLLMRRVLDGGLSARLQQELVERRGIVYEVGAEIETYADCGLLDFELAVAHQKLERALSELGRILVDLRQDLVSQEELDRVRNRAAMSLQFALDSTGELSQWFGVTRLFHDPIAPEQRIAELASITPAEIRRIARRYLKPDRLSIAAVGGANRAAVASARRVLKQLAEALS